MGRSASQGNYHHPRPRSRRPVAHHMIVQMKICGLAVAIAVTLPLAAGAQQVGGQNGTPVSAAPATPTDPLEPVPGSGSMTNRGVLPQTGPADGSTTSENYQNVYVNGEIRSWRPLEGDTQPAWEAYRNGDYTKAVPVFARLAKLGHPVAEWLMANIYYAGQGVPQDYRQALIWFEKAAAQGYMPAYAPTAQLYEQGKGTPIDLGRAYSWYNIAIAALPYSIERYGLMKQRDAVAAQMTQAQIEAAQKRSLAFQPRKVIPPDLEQARQMLGE
ncbi:MAG TPA: tetratricopeptide repeat protein [Dongiaceae bacterium]|nr:tetratricopeptide repeat protein [Dongiaceae bacterium]